MPDSHQETGVEQCLSVPTGAEPPADDQPVADVATGVGAITNGGGLSLVVGRVILDDYVVEKELGRGGMGVVYLFRSRSTRQAYAVKTTVSNKPDALASRVTSSMNC